MLMSYVLHYVLSLSFASSFLDPHRNHQKCSGLLPVNTFLWKCHQMWHLTVVPHSIFHAANHVDLVVGRGFYDYLDLFVDICLLPPNIGIMMSYSHALCILMLFFLSHIIIHAPFRLVISVRLPFMLSFRFILSVFSYSKSCFTDI